MNVSTGTPYISASLSTQSGRGTSEPFSMREIVGCETPSRRAISSWLIPRLLSRADASSSRCLTFGLRGGVFFLRDMRVLHFLYPNRIARASTKMRISTERPCQAVEVTDMLREAPELATTEYWRRLMKRARQDADLSQGQLAEKVGMSQAMLSRIESGDVRSSKAIVQISEKLGIPLPQFATGDELDLRWQQAGSVLRRRDHSMFSQHLELVEALVAKLSTKR